MDEQVVLDLETKAARYDRIVTAQARLMKAQEEHRRLSQQLKSATTALRNALMELHAVMAPVRQGVRG